MSSICLELLAEAERDRPAGAGSRAGRRGSRGCRPARSGAGEPRLEGRRRPGGWPPSRAPCVADRASSDSPVSRSVSSVAATQRPTAAAALVVPGHRARPPRRRRRRRPRSPPAGSCSWSLPGVSCVCRWTWIGLTRWRSAMTQRRARGVARSRPVDVLDREDVHTGDGRLLGEAKVVVERGALLAGRRRVSPV